MNSPESAVDWIAQAMRRKYAVFVPNGTAALELAMLAAGAGPGREVVIPEECCTAVLSAVLRTGATPCLAAVDADCLLTAITVHQALTERTCAVIAIHQWGRRIDPIVLNSVLPSGVTLIEDAASYWDPERPFQAASHPIVLSFGEDKPFSLGGGGCLGADSDDALLLTGLAGIPLFERDIPFVPYACLPLTVDQLKIAMRSARRSLARRRSLAAQIDQLLGAVGGGLLGGASADHCWQIFPILASTRAAAEVLGSTAHRFDLIARTLRSRPLPDTPLARQFHVQAPAESEFQQVSHRLVILQPPTGARIKPRVTQWLQQTPADFSGGSYGHRHYRRVPYGIGDY